MTLVRTRFAPSPTGYLHLGNIRSALYPWAYARKHGGAFILRIEDTDAERSSQEAVAAILDSMEWLGLDYDEGPFYQTQRMDRYAAAVAAMLAAGTAYHCYATAAELEAMRAAQLARGEKPRYDRRWRPEAGKKLPAVPHGVPPVVRFRNPLAGTVVWQDAVKGRVEIANDELDDLVIARSDGAPTYNFCVVVDDLEMRISHVIRGDDHVNNTPRQINLIRALGGSEPVYAHLPTVLTPQGEKLSKRHGARGVLQYRDEGYLAEAVVNYLARLGWAHGDAEIFARGEFVAWFDLAGLSPSPGRFDPDKLEWVNHEHIKKLSDSALAERLRPFFERAGYDLAHGPAVESVAALLRDRSPTLATMTREADYFYGETAPLAELHGAYASKVKDFDRVQPALADLAAVFRNIDWTRGEIGASIKSAADRNGLSPPQVMMAVRAVVTGVLQTPAIDAVLTALGRERTVERLSRSLQA